MQELNIKYMNIRDLKPYKKNAKKHSKEQVEQIAEYMAYGCPDSDMQFLF